MNRALRRISVMCVCLCHSNEYDVFMTTNKAIKLCKNTAGKSLQTMVSLGVQNFFLESIFTAKWVDLRIM